MSGFLPTDVPFPHVVEDGYWPVHLLDLVVSEFPAPTDNRWKRYGNQNEGKLEGPPAMWGHATKELFDQFDALTPLLSGAFEIPDLSMETIGGGYHLIPPGGHLQVHTDFNRSPETRLYRRLNLLVFLNRDWQDPGGLLELHGDDRVVEIAPEFNRTVVFETSDRSWHGHPYPPRRWRFSCAAYFFSPEPPPGFDGEHSTRWLSDA
jgi:hypothetical protein